MTGSALLVEPAYLSVPSYRRTLGPEVADICSLAGFEPDAEQRMVLDAVFAENDPGKSAASRVAIIACRQNLKTAVLEMCALGWLFVTDQNLIVWSAHEFSTSQETHRHLAGLIEDCPPLSSRVKTITRGNGDEGIELVTGQRVKFKARTKTGGRGLSGDKIVLDEAFALRPDHMGSLQPTVSARSIAGDPQILYGSSAGRVESDVLRGVRDRGRQGSDARMVYVEYCDDLPGECGSPTCTHEVGSEACRLDDERRWARANPAMGRRISVEAIRDERADLTAAEFARERLGWWDDPDELLAIFPRGKWAALEDPRSKVVGKLEISVDVRPDRSWGAIAVAGLRADKVPHIEVVDHRPGADWIPGRVAELRRRHRFGKTIVDRGSAAGSLIPELTDVREIGAAELGRACGAMADLVTSGGLRHLGQPELDDAVDGATKRTIGDAYAWDRKGEKDICPLVAATQALWGLTTRAQAGWMVSLG